ncbi:MAG: DUF4199 domain-containing protein [Bacteroidota bacterium]
MTTLDQEPKAPPSIMNIAVKWGLISTGVTILVFIVRVVLSQNPMENNWVGGLLGLAIGVTLLVLAQNEYKKTGDGFMGYGTGFKIGFLVSIVSIISYALFIFIYTSFVDANLMDAVYQAQREKMEAGGNMTDDQIETGIKFAKMLFWPIFLIGGLFINAILILIITIFTQKPNPNPAL